MKAVVQWVLRTMMKDQTGVMRTLPKKDLVDFNVAMTAERLMQNGIDPRALKNADQVENAIKQIEAPRKVQKGIKSTKSAKVFDMEGKEIPKGSKILGGKQAETEAEIAARISKENKESAARIKNKKMVDDAIDNASPGFSGDTKIDAELVAEDLAERMGLVYDDLPTKQRLDLYDQAYTGLSKQRFKNRPASEDRALEDFVDDAGGVDPDDPRGIDDFIPDDDPEPLAQGGRAGFKDGLLSMLDIQAAGSKSGKQQIMGAPEGFTMDNETYNFIVNADIPIGEKINLLTKYQYGKGRTRIERDGQEIFLDEGGSKSRDIGFGFNKEGEGIGGTLMYNMETGKPEFNVKIKKSFADGGRIGLKVGTGKKFLQRVFGKEKFEEMKSRDPEMYVGLLEVVDMYRKRDKEGLKMYLQKFLPHMDDAEIEAFIIGSDGTEGLVGELIRLGSGRDYKGKIEMIKRSENIRKLDNLKVTEDMIRKPNADGGRIGFKEGMTRRTFLKLLGGMAAIPIVGKFFKLSKVGKTVKKIPVIKTDNVAGKPEWFDALVNKVITEGDDVTKKFATGERQSIHQKTLDDGSVVRVTEDVDDGAVRVEYESYDNVFEDPVQLQYKKPLPDEGAPRPAAEFTTAESGPVGRAQGPDDFDIDIDEVGGTSIRDLDSDVSKLKEYATGKKPTMKELVQNIKRREKAAKITEGGDEMIDAVTRRQGDYVPEPDDFASGGIARMLGE